MTPPIERLTLTDRTLEFDAAANAWFEVDAERTRISTRRALRLIAALGMGMVAVSPASAAYGGGSSAE